MKTITTIDEAKAIKPGAYPVKGAVGVIFRKTADIAGVGAFNQRVSVGGGRRWISLGVLKRFAKLSEVQAKSRQVLAACDEGQNPFEARRTRKKRAHKAPVTFRQSTATYRVGYTPTLKGPYADKNWFNPIERHVFPALGDLLMSEIDGRDVAGVMNALDAKGLAKAALPAPGCISPIFTLAMANGDRPLAMGNPADSALLKALRPGKYALDDEHYPRIELTDTPLAIAALRKAREAIGDGLMSSDISLLAAALDAWLVMAADALEAIRGAQDAMGRGRSRKAAGDHCGAADEGAEGQDQAPRRAIELARPRGVGAAPRLTHRRQSECLRWP